MGRLSLLVATLFLIEVYAGIPGMTRVVDDENKASVQNQIAVPQDEWTKLEVGSEAATAPDKASEAPQHLVARNGDAGGAKPAPTLSKKRSWAKLRSFGRKSKSKSPSDSSSRASSPARSDSLSHDGSFSGSDDGYSSDGSQPRLMRSNAMSRERSKRYQKMKLDTIGSSRSLRRHNSSSPSKSRSG